jgi:uncharacterized protein YbaP (TraB family)
MKNLAFICFVLTSLMVNGQAPQNENELLWEISGNGLKVKSYLFGSLHSNDKRLFKLSDSTYYAMSKAGTIVLETDVFSLFSQLDTRKEEINLLYDNSGNPYTGNDRASKTLYGDEDGMPQFLDAYFQQYCYNSNKKFYALENVEDQIDMLTDFILPDADRVNFIATQLVQEKMIDLYLRGDISALDRIMRVNLSAYPGSYEQLIVERNAMMVNGIDSLIRQDGTFVAVGAGHLSGEQGLIQLLRKKGYKLRKVQATYGENPIKEKLEVLSKRSYTCVDEQTGIVAKFPGKPLVEKSPDGTISLVYREFGQGNTYWLDILPRDESLSLQDQAEIYIASPNASPYRYKKFEDDTEMFEGISDTYPEGVHWVRVMQNDQYVLIMKAYGGNKFMNSNRPKNFFNNIWFQY